jgi:hypothetical protein
VNTVTAQVTNDDLALAELQLSYGARCNIRAAHDATLKTWASRRHSQSASSNTQAWQLPTLVQ